MSSSRQAKLQCLLLPILNCPVRPSNNRKAGHGRRPLLLKISRGEKSTARARRCSDTETSHRETPARGVGLFPVQPSWINQELHPSCGKERVRRGRKHPEDSSGTAPTRGTDGHASNVCQARNEDAGAPLWTDTLYCTFENGKFHVYFTIHTQKNPSLWGKKYVKAPNF